MSGSVYSWDGPEYGDFDDPGNWYDVTTGAAAFTPPGMLDEAIVLAEGIIVGPGWVGELGLSGEETGLTLAETLSAGTDDLDGDINVTTDGALTATDLIDIGDEDGASIATYAPAFVSVAAGAYLSATANTPNVFDVLVGANQGEATLQISGFGAFLASGVSEIGIGDAGTGLVSVSGGGLIQGGIGPHEGNDVGLAVGIAGGNGTLNVSDFSSSAIFGDEVVVGAGGTGSLSIANGATLTAGNGTLSLLVGTIETSTTGTGAVTLDEAGATLNGLLDIGDGGVGTLSLTDAVVLANGNTSAGAVPASVVLGDAGGTGTLAMSGESLLTTTSGVLVGDGGAGDLDIAASSLIADLPTKGGSAPALQAGVGAGTTGVVDVSGGLIDDADSAGMIIGNAGNGTLAITEQGGLGGEVLTGAATGSLAVPSSPVPFGFGLTVGVAWGSSGTVSVAGSSSALTVAGSVLDGYFGTGLLALTDGAAFTAGYAAGAYGLVVGGGGLGTLTIGGGAQANILGESIVGLNGPGSLSITGASSFAGTSLLTGALLVAAGIGATAGVLISDPSTDVQLAGALLIGDGGKGSLTLQDQAVLAVSAMAGAAAPGIIVGTYSSTASGTLSLASGASLATPNLVEVGDTGYGELDVADSTLVITMPFAPAQPTPALEAGISAGSTGLIEVTGGLIEDVSAAGMIVGNTGSATLVIAADASQGGLVLTGQPGGTGLAVGMLPGSSGSVSVSGTASGLGVYGAVADGNGGSGDVTLAAGAHFVAGYAIGAAGLTIGGGADGTGSGNFTVTGGAQAAVLGVTNVGYGGHGTLTVEGGSSFSDTASSLYALGIGAPGGQGSMLISDLSTYVPVSGGMVVGGSGSGTLTVQNQAMLAIDAGAQSGNPPGIVLGSESGGAGTLALDSGAQLLASTGMLVGAGGTGLLDVAGGTLISTANPALGFPAVSAGADSGASGTILVNGGLIEDETSAGMVVGGAGNGSLVIAQAGSLGGTVLTGDPTAAYGLSVGVSAGAAGSISVSGTSSGLGVYGDVLVGGAGTGTIALSNGAQFVAGSSASANGLELGADGGSGALSLASGAQARVLGQIVIGETGSLSLSTGASMSASGVLNDGALVASGGTLSLAGGITGTGTLTISGNSLLALGPLASESNGLAFGTGGGTLTASTAADILGTITGWSAGDFVSLSGINAISETFANGTLSLFGPNSQLLGTLTFGGSNLTTHNFTITQQSAAGIVVGYHP